MEGLDILGATLADQYIVLRVKRIDRDRLKAKLAGSTGTLASAAVQAEDASAAAALDVALPIAVGKAKDYGIEIEASHSDVPPKLRSRALSEFWPGLVLGLGVGASSLAIVKLIGRIFKRSA
jgi:hypothetical protein